MELRYLLQLGRAYWRFIALVTLVAGLLGLSVTYILPESFEASTQVLIRPEQTPAFDQESFKAMMGYPLGFNVPVESISQTYAEIMTSDAIATKVEDALQLHTLKDPWPEGFWLSLLFTVRDYAKLAVFSTWDFVRYGRIEPQLPPYWKMVKDIKEGLSAKPVSDTYIFTLTASWSDPETAVRIADTAAAAFVEYSHDARTREEGTAAGFLGESLESTRQALDQARTRLDAARVITGAASVEQELALRLDDLAAFERERELAKKQLRELDAEATALGTLLSGASAARTIRGEARNEVESRLASRIADREAVAARIDALATTIAQYRKEADALSAHQSELAQLSLEVRLLEDNYQMIARHYEEARIAAAQTLSEIRVLHPAVRPRYPVGPIKLYFGGGGLAAGLLLALGLVLMLDYADHRVRSREDIETSIGVTVLASIPHAALPLRSAQLLGQRARRPSGLAWRTLPGRNGWNGSRVASGEDAQ